MNETVELYNCSRTSVCTLNATSTPSPSNERRLGIFDDCELTVTVSFPWVIDVCYCRLCSSHVIMAYVWWQTGGLAAATCFPAHALVETQVGHVRISTVKVGDKVRTPSGWEDVYLQGHADWKMHSYIEVFAANRSTMLSPDHYMFADGELRLARNLRPGMTVCLESECAAVSQLRSKLEAGAFNPYVKSGELYVDGFRHSCHSSFFLEGMLAEKHIPQVYQVVLYPVYMLYSFAPTAVKDFCAKHENGRALNEVPLRSLLRDAIAAIAGPLPLWSASRSDL